MPTSHESCQTPIRESQTQPSGKIFAKVGLDRICKFFDGVEHAACKPALGQLGKEDLDGVEEVDIFLVPVLLHALTDNFSVQHVEGGKQCGRAMPPIVMRHRAAAALFQRQARLGPVERLDVAFLVDRQHQSVGRRADIQPDDIA